LEYINSSRQQQQQPTTTATTMKSNEKYFTYVKLRVASDGFGMGTWKEQ